MEESYNHGISCNPACRGRMEVCSDITMLYNITFGLEEVPTIIAITYLGISNSYFERIFAVNDA